MLGMHLGTVASHQHRHPGVQRTGQWWEEKPKVLIAERVGTGQGQRPGRGLCHCHELWQTWSSPYLAHPMGRQTCGWRGLAPARIYLPAPG